MQFRIVGIALLAFGCGRTTQTAQYHSISSLDLRNLSSDSEQYRIGDDWGKHRPTSEELHDNPVFARATNATAKVALPFGAATGFYIGKFNNRHVFATNHHVCETENDCMSASLRFDSLGFRTKVAKFYGSWSDVDLALMAINVPEEHEKDLAAVATNFAFDRALVKGEELVTVGYGFADNPGQKIVINYDDDCRVFSESGEYKFMADPDEVNPAPYKAWSYAVGCDVSHGDSGSAIVDRASGDVVGIVWTGRIPKAKKVQDSKFLRKLLKEGGEEIWEELTYAVPTAKIRDYLKGLIDSGELTGEDAKTVGKVISQ